jgi:DNA polymerase-4
MKPKGITYVLPGMEKEFLAPMPVETIPGVGKVTLKSLNDKGIYTIGDIAGLPSDYFGSAFGKYGIDLWEKANGQGSEYLNPPQKRKSISKERTFSQDIVNKDEIESILFRLTGEVCQILRDRNWQTSTVSIKLRYSDFVTLTRASTVKPTDDDKSVFEIASKLFRKAYTRRVGVRLIGIHLSKFNEFEEQEILFEDKATIRKKMFRAVTKIRDRYGYQSIRLGNT